MLQRVCSGSLYTVLDVRRDATPQEVKKAYHRLALQVHPDKTGGATTEEFKLIQEAQAVLTDPQQRRVYDTFGKQGLNALNHLGDASALLNPAAIRATSFLLGLWMLMLLISLELTIIKLDYSKKWHWASVFVPYWIALIPLLALGLILLRHGIFQREIAPLVLGFGCLLVIVASATFVAGLSGVLKWTSALAPSIVIYLLERSYVLRFLIPSQFRRLSVNTGDEIGNSTFFSRMYCLFALNTLFETVCVIVFIVLAMLRAAQTDNEKTTFISFWIIFAPLIVYFGFMTLVSAFLGFSAKVSNEVQSFVTRTCRAITSSMFYGSFVYMTCMMAAKCNVEQNQVFSGIRPSAAITLIPLQIVLVLSVLLPCCMCCFVDGTLDIIVNEEVREASKGAGNNGNETSDRTGLKSNERQSGMRERGEEESSVCKVEVNTRASSPKTKYREI